MLSQTDMQVALSKLNYSINLGTGSNIFSLKGLSN